MFERNRSARPLFAVMLAAALCAGLYAAAVFQPASQPAMTIGPYVLKNTNLALGATKAYRPWYENGAWQGDIIEYDISQTGDRTTDVDVGSNPPSAPGVNWSARATFAKKESSSTYWSNQRKIIMHNGTNQVAFRWDSLSDAQKQAVDPLTFADSTLTASYDSYILNWIRGERANEVDKLGGTLRRRYSLLGDIIGSKPVYVGPPAGRFRLAGYATFKNTYQDRKERLYVGANDGMLHVFDIADGSEVYAYIPSMLIDKLKSLAIVPYTHTYYVDGELGIADAVVNANWKTVLVAGMGAGAKGLFGLDITNPDLSAETSNTGTNKKILWEIDGSDADMGYIYGRPRINLLADGNFYAITGNGYGSASGIAKLLLVRLDNASVTEISTGLGPANGLSAPVLLDTNYDFVADVAYAGDLKGNLWKFDLTNMASPTVTKLFAGTDSRPITTAPEIGNHPLGGVTLYSGTGSLLSLQDASNNDTQSVYGIWDAPSGSPPYTVSDLLAQTLVQQTHPDGKLARRIDNQQAMDWNTYKGWRVDLPNSGERLIGNPQLRASRLQFITSNPTSQSGSVDLEGDSWLLELDWLSGGAPSQVMFDLNGNGNLDDGDKLDDGSGNLLVPVGLNLGIGNLSQPTIGRLYGGTDALFVNGIILPLPQIDPGGPLLSGHIDVGTDSPSGGSVNPDPVANNDGLGFYIDGHVHGYDDIHNVTYMDYFKLEPRRGQAGLNASPVDMSGGACPAGSVATLDEAGNITGCVESVEAELNRLGETYHSDGPGAGAFPMLDPDQKFIVVLANGDLSPAGTLQIGCRTWNVAEYENMLTKQLEAGVLPADLKDTINERSSRGTLVFTLNEILSDGGTCPSDSPSPTLRVSFNFRAIIDAGIHPTRTQCVKGLHDYNYPVANSDDDIEGGAALVADPGATDPSMNSHITEVYFEEGSGYRWRNGALTMQLLAVNDDDSPAYTLQPPTGNGYQYLPYNRWRGRFGGTYAKAFELTKVAGKAIMTATATNPPQGADQSGLLYESYVYWHYGDLYQLLRTGGPVHAPCYGEDYWKAAVNIEQRGLTLGEYNDLITALSQDEIADYATKLLALENALASGDENAINQAILDLNNLLDSNSALAEYDHYREYAPGHVPEQHLLDIDKGLADGGNSSTGDGTPAEVKETSLNVNPNLGPNFVAGRRTWIDLRN
jgi:hypothetical protein